MSDYLVGIDLGGTNINVGVTDDVGKVITKHAVPLGRPKTRHDVLDAIYRAAEETLSRAGMEADAVRAIGIATPGVLDIENGVVVKASNLPDWENVALRDLVRKRFGVPTVLENDANAAAWGEYWAGAGKEVASMVMLTLGTGIGGGIVIDGKLWHGFRDSAAEIGHVTIDYDGRKCACGNIGCLEAYASAASTVRRFIEAVRSGKSSNLERMVQERPEGVTSKMIYEEALKGDGLCRKIMEETGFYLGVGIVSVLHFLNPEMVVLTGGLTGAGSMLMDPVKRVVSERALPRFREDLQIVFARLGEDAGFIGAAGCALSGSETSAS
ncbi:MAG TPA: ROK family protein [Planctomycetota bacterium]|nr:ROK family protein [Planctomycetota bacterium]